MKLEFPCAVPEIPVRDINEVAAYYENNLGFTLDWGGFRVSESGVRQSHEWFIDRQPPHIQMEPAL